MNKTNTYYLNTTKSLRKEQHHNPNGLFTVYYSYATPVAFSVNGATIVSENVWSRTTGKHLTQIDGGEEKFFMYKKPKGEIIVDRFIIGLLVFKAIYIAYLILIGG
jgi:hypothetical protein